MKPPGNLLASMSLLEKMFVAMDLKMVRALQVTKLLLVVLTLSLVRLSYYCGDWIFPSLLCWV